MSSDEGNRNGEARIEVNAAVRFSSFELHHSFGIRHSDFGINNRFVKNCLACA